jgi:hypothetical protein
MRFRFLEVFAVLAVLALSAPVWARTKSVDVHLTEASTIGSTQLQPGEYQLKAEEGASQVSIVHRGKVVAEVPCHWVQLQSKPSQSQVLFTSNQITEVDFGGDTQAAQF